MVLVCDARPLNVQAEVEDRGAGRTCAAGGRHLARSTAVAGERQPRGPFEGERGRVCAIDRAPAIKTMMIAGGVART
jgi:hypothetical protein